MLNRIKRFVTSIPLPVQRVAYFLFCASAVFAQGVTAGGVPTSGLAMFIAWLVAIAAFAAIVCIIQIVIAAFFEHNMKEAMHKATHFLVALGLGGALYLVLRTIMPTGSSFYTVIF